MKKGNQNAVKEIKKNTSIKFRCTEETKKKLQALAEFKEISLSKLLDDLIEKELSKHK